MKWIFAVLILMFIQSVPATTFAQHHHGDSLTRKQTNKIKREAFRKATERNFLKFGAVNARLKTNVEFDLVDGLLTATVGLEANLGLPGRRTFFTAACIHRFTPASGLYANYYGINRTENHVTDRDIIFQSDTIPAGTRNMVYFNTQVVSTGYLLSLMQDPNAFLGAYFNLYFMWLKTGIRSGVGNLDAEVNYVAPLPNFGIVAMFKLKRWLSLEGNVGFFTLTVNDFDGTLFDLNVKLNFMPTRWLGLSISYQEFDIRVGFPYEGLYTTVDYNFRGPALGMNISF